MKKAQIIRALEFCGGESQKGHYPLCGDGKRFEINIL
jgi:hypothetical protein